MHNGVWQKRGGGLLLGVGVVLLAASTVRGEELTPEELRARLDRVEKLNQELLKRLEALESGGNTGSPVILQGKEAEGTVPGLDKDAVKKIVGDYLKTEDEKKKKKEEEKKKEEAEQWYEVGKDLGMTARWNNGLHVETKDKAFRIHPTGRFQWDLVWMTAPDNVMFGRGGVGDVLDASAFRRARVGVEGTMWEVINFHFEPDFFNTLNVLTPGTTPQQATSTHPVPIDNWIEVAKLPIIGNVRMGSVKPEYSIEHLTSSRNLDFLERSLIGDAYIVGLDNGFQPGFVVYNSWCDDRIRVASSITKNNENIFGFNVGDGEWNYVLRVTGLPVYEHEGRCLVHVGGSVCHKDLDQDQYRFRSRTTLRNGPAALQTRLTDIVLFGNSMDMVLPEFAVTWGPFNMFVEYAGVWTNGVTVANNAFLPPVQNFPGRTVFYQGFNVEALYFLTGENRGYNKKMAFFDRPKVLTNFFRVKTDEGICTGWGAWQVGVRYSWTDFNDAGINGGIAQDWTLGVNWFLCPTFKIQANYVINRRDIAGLPSNGYIQGFGIRTAWDF